MRRAIVVLVVLSMIVAAGCSGSDTTASKGSATEGATLFASTCASCHSVEPDKVIVGPSLAGMATDAAGDAADEGVSTEEILKKEITDPNDEVVDGFEADIMPKDFGTTLSEQELNDVIAYLMTLK